MSKKKHKSQCDKCPKCAQWQAAVLSVAAKYGAMGFRHDAGKAQAVDEVMLRMGFTLRDDPHQVAHVAGLTSVHESL